MREAPEFLHVLPRNYNPFFLHMVSALTSKASREMLYLTQLVMYNFTQTMERVQGLDGEEKTTVEAANMWSS